MVEEDYVSFEIAKLLKEKGFNELVSYAYDDEGMLWRKTYNPEDINIGRYDAPTLQMARKWLEEVYGLIISIEYQNNCSTWKWRVYINSSNKKHTDFQHYDKSETACEIAIKYCLEYLIK